MPLVINSLGADTHTSTHAYQHLRRKHFQETSHVLAAGWRVPGLKSGSISYSIGNMAQQLTMETHYVKQITSGIATL